MADSRKIKVYLGGPIKDVEFPNEWRENAVAAFDSHLETVNPMDWQEVFHSDPASGARKDLGEMFACDVLLVNLTDAPEPAICAGTRAEVAMWGAWQIVEQMQQAVLHGPAVLVFKDEEQEKLFDPWVTMIGVKTFYDIEKAVQWLNLESSTWTTGGEPVNSSSPDSPESSSLMENPPSEIVGSDGQPLSSETLSGSDETEPATTPS
jgi:hypothetical protein